MKQPGFQPFYEKIAERLPGPSPLIWKVCLSALLGLAFLASHFRYVREDVFDDWSWLLSVLISASMLLLYYATYTLRGTFPQMDRRLHKKGEEYRRSKQSYFMTIRRTLSNRKFVGAGFFFGVLNCLMGYSFGVPYSRLESRVTLFVGFFVVGFICGMAALGIYGVLGAIKVFMRAENLEIDYSEPDGCGGMLFLGEALVKFGSVTLIMGVLIAIFIVNFEWTNRGSVLVKALKWFWIAFPFVLSLIVLLAPSAEINRILSDYKVREEEKIEDELTGLRARTADTALPAADREAARKDYDYYNKLRAEVYKMRTWPYDVSSSVQYAGMFIANAAAVVWKAVLKMIGM